MVTRGPPESINSGQTLGTSGHMIMPALDQISPESSQCLSALSLDLGRSWSTSANFAPLLWKKGRSSFGQLSANLGPQMLQTIGHLGSSWGPNCAELGARIRRTRAECESNMGTIGPELVAFRRPLRETCPKKALGGEVRASFEEFQSASPEAGAAEKYFSVFLELFAAASAALPWSDRPKVRGVSCVCIGRTEKSCSMFASCVTRVRSRARVALGPCVSGASPLGSGYVPAFDIT